MSLHLIRIIAAYEMRTLLRSWFFRIFAGGAIFGLGIFNLALNIESSGAPWIYKALAASIPYANLIILNLGQAVVAVFLASEFLKQDRKNDTVEVIYARSMTNGQYIAGKTLGILAVFLVLNIIILVIGIGFSFMSNTSSHNLFAYFGYPLLISLPTLVFILGLSFFIMVLVKNQAVTFILLTGYIALTVFYLNKKAYHLFDYIAYQVPMMFSSISGFASFSEILLHRSIYFLLGTGFILLTVFRLPRLPQSPKFSSLPLFLGLGMLSIGGILVVKYLDLKRSIHTFRQEVVALNNRYAGVARTPVRNCYLDLEHRENAIVVDALMQVINPNEQALDSLLFSLNPSLELQAVLINGNNTPYSRNLQIITIKPDQAFLPGDTLQVRMKYSGQVNENMAFLDLSAEDFEANFHFEVFTLRKRYAFLQKNYVCLTSESLWYPISGTGYATSIPMGYRPDFTRYKIKVTTSPDLTVLSQGRLLSAKNGVFEFEPEYALPRITLLIGDYKQHTIRVDSIDYALYTIRGHEYFKPLFDQINDTLPTLIRDLKKEYEASLGYEYPFNRLTFAEVPVHFALDNHAYSYASDAVQPELILGPEKGVMFNSSDFRNRKFRIEKERKDNNEEALPEDIQADMFNQFFRNNFMARRGQQFYYGEVVSWQTFSLVPQYLSLNTRLESEKWPVLGMVMEVYSSERNNTSASTLQWYEDLSIHEKINLELGRASLEELLKAGIEAKGDDRERFSVRDVVQAKGLQLFNVWRAKYGEKELDTLFTMLIRDYPHQLIPYAEMHARFRQRFNADLTAEIENWYVQRELPGFLIRNISSYKVPDGEATRYQVRFQLSNPEVTDGIVTLNVEMNDPNRVDENFYQDEFKVDFSRKIFLPAKSAYEVGYVFNSEPVRMSVVTHISKNLPGNLIYALPGFTETKKIPLLDGFIPMQFFNELANEQEIIVDNEDKGFTYEQASDRAYLKSLIKNKKQDRYKYSSISWRPPGEWKTILRSEFYGGYVRSACYTKGGTGERMAQWKAKLPGKAAYDVYFHLDKVNLFWRGDSRSPEYDFTVYHDNGTDKITQVTSESETGWNYLGTFFISSDTGKVELTNKTSGDMIFADAVKWVLTK